MQNVALNLSDSIEKFQYSNGTIFVNDTGRCKRMIERYLYELYQYFVTSLNEHIFLEPIFMLYRTIKMEYFAYLKFYLVEY